MNEPEEVQRWIKNAEKGVREGKAQFVIKSATELETLGRVDLAEDVLRTALPKFGDNLYLVRKLCSLVVARDASEGLKLVESIDGKLQSGLGVPKATALHSLGRSVEAASILEEEIRNDARPEKDRMVVTKLASIYLETGAFSKAATLLEPFVEGGIYTHPRMRQFLADAHVRNGQPEKALKVLDGLFDAQSIRLRERAKEKIGGSPHMTVSHSQPEVFVVYGHDDSWKDLEGLLYRIGARPLVFPSLAKAGSETIIEILERYLPKADAVVILMTPDDEGRKRGTSDPLQPRTRENVLIEAGCAMINRRDKSLLVALGGVNIPSDFQGIHRIQDSAWSSTVEAQVASRLHDMGLNVDVKKAIRT